jgi:flagellar protein FliO/FliZ
MSAYLPAHVSRRSLRGCVVGLAVLPAMARASEVGSAVPALGVGAVLQTLLGLVLVIGLVFACAWLARRTGFHSAARGGALKVVSSVAVGGKERATLVEIGDTWLVLGVAPGNVRLLHTLPAGGAGAHAAQPSVVEVAEPVRSAMSDLSVPSASFGRRFREALAGEARKRLLRSPS